jgi:hypothetical protein
MSGCSADMQQATDKKALFKKGFFYCQMVAVESPARLYINLAKSK